MSSIKRNNPGNIRHSAVKWQGEVTPPGEAFCQFISLEMGCRAMLKLLKRYIDVKRLDSIRKVITRWAPPTENRTDEYIQFVSSQLGTHPGDTLRSDEETLIALASEMTIVEHGQSVPAHVWRDAYHLL